MRSGRNNSCSGSDSSGSDSGGSDGGDTTDPFGDDDSGSDHGGGGGSSSGGPNLEINYFDHTTDDGTIYYYVDVINTGTEASGTFYVDLFVDQYDEPMLGDLGDEFSSVSDLEPGETAYADFIVDTTCTWCSSWAYADIDQYIIETDEADNVAGPLDVTTSVGW